MTFDIVIQSEFNYIVRSFQFVAAMFSSGSGYLGFIATLGVFGIFFGGLSMVMSQGSGGKSSIQSWLLNMTVSATLLVMLTASKSTVIVHDTTINQFRTIGGVPTAMAAIAFMENKVEQGIKDIIETVLSPIIPYDQIGKGTGFELLASFDTVAKSYFTERPHIKRSLESYWKKCVVPDLTYGWISEDAIYKSDDMWKDIKSETATRFSEVWRPGGGSPDVQACNVAWVTIDNQITDTDMRNAMLRKCETSNGNEAAALDACITNTVSILDTMVLPAPGSLNGYIHSYLVAWTMMPSGGMLESMLADVNRKNASQAFIAEKMLPRLKGMLYGMIIGIFPLLIAFIWFNPAKTIVFYLGLFLLMILWSAIDTFMDMQYQHEVFNMFAEMRRLNLGLHQMFDISNIAADAVSLYGSGRWMALGVAAHDNFS